MASLVVLWLVLKIFPLIKVWRRLSYWVIWRLVWFWLLLVLCVVIIIKVSYLIIIGFID